MFFLIIEMRSLIGNIQLQNIYIPFDLICKQVKFVSQS